MADRTDFYFRQKVTEAELDLAFELLEKAVRNLAADIGIYGIISGAEPTPHAPVPDLTIDLTAPGRAYDNLGQRIFFGTGQVVDCSVDHAGLPTEVPVVGQERWLGVFLRFDRLLSDPRTDGNSQQVFFRRDESFEIVVRQGPTAALGAAPKVPLKDDELLVCDVHRTNGQGQILAPDIDTSRRQSFIFAEAEAVEIVSGLWNILEPAVNTVQAALDELDAELNDHFTGAARRHPAGDIDYTPHGFVASATVQAALDELIDDLSATAAGEPGAKRVGADAVAGTPNALPAGNVDGQLSQILAWLNAHLSAAAGAHNASAIAAAAHNYISGPSVQAQLQEIVDDLQSTGSGLGAAQIGNDAIGGSPKSLAATTLRAQLSMLLGHLNTHIGSADHDSRYYTEAESDARYYNEGDQVDDADTVDGQHASAFATAGHDHDTRYLRRIYTTQVLMDAGASQVITTQSEQPDLVSVSYNYPDAGTGLPQSTTYARGNLTNELRYWITKIDQGGGDKDYRITVSNASASQLWVNVAVHRRD
ncbi:MAG: hypothetical protein CSA24_02415 [Deltaproteobacteria bacterium]|nr:MAG: hypothetical protein CSA24_02415 [Deltaproteobacteria bacterium]